MPVGCAGRITSYAEASDGRYLVTVTGVSRFRITTELPVKTPYRQARVHFEEFEADLLPPGDHPDFEREDFIDALRGYLTTRAMDIDWDTAEGAPMEALVNSLSMALPFEPAEKQYLLESVTLLDRATALRTLMQIAAAEGADHSPTSMQ